MAVVHDREVVFGASARFGAARTAILAIVQSAAVGACGDPVAPWPELPQNRPLLASITEWSVSEPDIIQRGRFVYDGSGRLMRYDFALVLSSGELVVYYVVYEYASGRLLRSNTFARDGDPSGYFDTFSHVAQSEFAYDVAGRPESIRMLSLGESGEVGEAVVRYEYGASDRILREWQGDEAPRVYAYDAHGNVIRDELPIGDGATLLYSFEYQRSFNPLAGTPADFHGVILVNSFSGFRMSPYNVSRFTVGEKGKPPAATGVVSVELRANGYPCKRSVTVTNSDLPHLPTTIITEFEYRDET